MQSYENITVMYIQNESTCKINTVPFLKSMGLNVLDTSTFETACDLFRHNKVDIMLVDLDFDFDTGLGMTCIRCLRDKNILVPVIVTTNDIHQTPLLEILNLEVSSCLIHPYELKDLQHAVEKAIIKNELSHPLTYTDLNMGYSYDPISKQIMTSDGNIIKLCKKEALLIELLLQNAKHVTSYEMIETIVWEDDFMSIDSLRTLIRGIRKKTYPNIITNQNSIGYKIDL